MKTKILIIIGAVLLALGLSVNYYVSAILLPPTEPPLMKEITEFELFFTSNRSMFGFFGFIGGIICAAGIVLAVISRRRK